MGRVRTANKTVGHLVGSDSSPVHIANSLDSVDLSSPHLYACMKFCGVLVSDRSKRVCGSFTCPRYYCTFNGQAEPCHWQI